MKHVLAGDFAAISRVARSNPSTLGKSTCGYRIAEARHRINSATMIESSALRI
jgi:hypothetical protein